MNVDFTLTPGQGLPHSALARLREGGPVVWSDSLQGWLVTSYDAVKTVLSDVTRFTSQGTPVSEAFGTEAMLVNDTPFHHRIRAVWARKVGVAAMEARLEEFRGYAGKTLGEALIALKAGETIDLVPVFQEFVIKVIASTFDLPQARMDVIRRWSALSADTPALEIEEGSEAQKRHFAARKDVYELIAEQVQDRKARLAGGEEPEDLIALMVAAEGQEGITPSVVADNLFNFILGALDTSEKWFGNIICRLYGDSEILSKVRAERSLIPALIDEVMRFDTVAQVIQRKVRHDGVELCGQAMKAGNTIMVMLGAANRDEVIFPEPDRFDLHRKVTSNLGFGFGFHHCLGLNIARQEAIALVNAALDTFDKLRIEHADFGDSWALHGPRALYVSLPE